MRVRRLVSRHLGGGAASSARPSPPSSSSLVSSVALLTSTPGELSPGDSLNASLLLERGAAGAPSSLEGGVRVADSLLLSLAAMDTRGQGSALLLRRLLGALLGLGRHRAADMVAA
eukprot:CAMPEP_0174941744 /NCGR_PEP_ID=MMETSP1355-20121228/72583_1 /TAXON_ID=464990 /ORGANISM="Hemiselmis tepida, Strain CCMP443" /LENGTH=115 /DNA_ID=CAMNT_0016188869 /DNA_START=34 /DNA_END=377 /DNA_ORIENTATION=+